MHEAFAGICICLHIKAKKKKRKEKRQQVPRAKDGHHLPNQYCLGGQEFISSCSIGQGYQISLVFGADSVTNVEEDSNKVDSFYSSRHSFMSGYSAFRPRELCMLWIISKIMFCRRVIIASLYLATSPARDDLELSTLLITSIVRCDETSERLES